MWYHFQDNIRRALGNRTQRLVNGRIALDANIDTLNEHCSDIEKQWDLIMAEVRAPRHNSSASRNLLCVVGCTRPHSIQS